LQRQQSKICGSHLFITDRICKLQFLVDTAFDPCVYSRRFIPRRKERVNYDLCAANGTTIPTYGWLLLSLNLGLRRDFTWLFVVADVTQPLIGVEFLSHFGLLVDCRHKRLLDGVTSSSVPAQADSSLIPSIKTITGGGTPVDSSLVSSRNSLASRSPAESAPEHRSSRPDYTRATGHLPTTATGTGPTRYRQSRVRRHVAGRHNPPLREFLSSALHIVVRKDNG
jgi:hypothetical protein